MKLFYSFIWGGIFLFTFLFPILSTTIVNFYYIIFSLEFFITFMVICGIFFVSFLLFIIFNRKRKEVVEVVEFNAPKDITPTDAGYLIDLCIEDKDISSLLVYWAAKKYIFIDEKGDDFVILKKLKNSDDKMKGYEKKIFELIFAENDEIDLSLISQKIAGQSQEIVKSIKMENKKFIKTNAMATSKLFILGASCLFTCTTILTGIFYGYEIYLGWFIFLIAILFTASINKIYVQNRSLSIFKYIIGLCVICLVIGLNLFFTLPFTYFYLLKGVSAFVFLMTCILSPLIENRTAAGKKVLGQLLGLKKFIEVAEKDKMEMLVRQTPELYYEILPYAYVLNVTNKWIEQFNVLKIFNEETNKKYIAMLGVLKLGTISLNNITKNPILKILTAKTFIKNKRL